MKKTLVICGRYPLPEDHGSPMRTMNFVRFFKNYGQVDVAYSRSSGGEEEGRTVFNNSYYFKKNKLPRKFLERVKRSLSLHRIPLPIEGYDAASEKMLLSRIESEDYDYILTRYIVNSSILLRLPEKYRKRVIIDFDDILSGSLYDSMYGTVQELHKKIIAALNRKFLMNYEKRCLHFGASLFCSEKDMAYFAPSLNGSSAFVVPNIYANKSFGDFDFGDGFDNGNILLFVGALGYGPNERGLKWFIETIFPHFKDRYADGRLLVVGRTPDSGIRALCSGTEGVELYTDAPDIKEYYKECRAVIVPLLAGGGTRIKILEAALTGRPVISTPVGAEGLDLKVEKEILLFETAHDFSAQFNKLSDRKIYNSLVNSAKTIVLTDYSIKRFYEVMEVVLRELGWQRNN
jgi:glycosyltransferase involved in cell wall biosynthesis